jgi:predicted dehydrogenase
METEERRKLRVAALGCGGIGAVHCAAYHALPETDLVAVADVNPDALEKLGEAYGVPGRYADYRELLESESPDLVSVCAWPALHAPMTLAAAEAGVSGILCEKPLASNRGDALRMVEACESRGIKLAVGYQHRYNPIHALAKRLLAEGEIGAPRLIRSRTNRGLLNNGSHGIDLIRYLLGDPPAEWVIGQVGRETDRWERGQRIEDFAIGEIGFGGDVRATIQTDLPGGVEFYPLIVGETGMIDLKGDHLILTNAKGAREERPEPNGGDHAAGIAGMAAWLLGGPEHRSTARHGLTVIEIIMALYESARSRERVSLPFAASESPLERMIEEGDLPVRIAGKVEI